MDTSKLVVGQEVRMSGLAGTSYGWSGTVLKVTPEGVEVRTSAGNMSFDSKGEYDGSDPFSGGPCWIDEPTGQSMPSIGIDMPTGLIVGPQQDRAPREVGRAASHDSIDHDDPDV
jgi:hypothetical protein